MRPQSLRHHQPPLTPGDPDLATCSNLGPARKRLTPSVLSAVIRLVSKDDRWSSPDTALARLPSGVPILAFSIRGIAMSRKGKNGGSCGPR